MALKKEMSRVLKEILLEFREIIPKSFEINHKEFCLYNPKNKRIQNENWQDIIKETNIYWNPNIHYEFTFNEKGTTSSIDFHVEYKTKKYVYDQKMEKLANILEYLYSKLKNDPVFKDLTINVHKNEPFDKNQSERGNLEISLKDTSNNPSDIAKLMVAFIEKTHEDISKEYQRLEIKAPVIK